jgi:hypothetical protein
MSPYRCESSMILETLVFTNYLCGFLGIESGKIKLGCDGISTHQQVEVTSLAVIG